MNRNRWLYLGLTCLLVLLGLTSRSDFIDKDTFIADYSGDTLWAMMVYLGFSAIFTRTKIVWIATVSIAFSFIIEFSQLLQYPWLMQLRSDKLAALVLGRGFLWSDLLCYLAGIGFITIGEVIVFKKYCYNSNKPS